MGPFVALDDPADPEAWADLAGLLGPGGRGVLFRDEVEVPPGWSEQWRGAGVQMVAHAGIGHHQTPFLQAAAPNAGAIRLYRELGSEITREVMFAAVIAPEVT